MKWVFGFLMSFVGLAVKLPVMVLGVIVVPIALQQTFYESRRLPRWAYWWGNEEDGLDGPDKHMGKYPKGSFKRRFIWLVLRNPCSNFGQQVVGFHACDAWVNVWKQWGDPSDWSGTTGLILARADVKGFPWVAPMIKLNINYGKYNLEWLWGWKLWEVTDYDPKDPWVNLATRIPHPFRKVKK